MTNNEYTLDTIRMKAMQKLLRVTFLSGMILFLLIPLSLRGANHVKIATIGAVPPHLDLSQEPQLLVEQMIAFWEKELAQVLPDHPDLIVLPEACDRPAGLDEEMRFRFFRTRGKQITDYFSGVASKHHCYIAFGTIRQMDDKSWRNSCILLDREGNIAGVYNKNFPVINEMEAGIKAGTEAPVFQCDFGTVGCAICFDLNFDELRMRYAAQQPDIMLFPSMYHGGLVQAGWAYSCRSYFVSAVSSRDLPSEIRDPMGRVVATSTNYFDFTVATVNLDYCLAHLDFNWEKLSALKKKYGGAVTISDPGRIGSVLLTSEDETLSVEEMVREFEITLLDDYMDNSRAFRHKPGMME